MARRNSFIIVHCSDSAWGDLAVVESWHVLPPPKGRGWKAIGYNYLIQNPYPTYQHLKQGTPSDWSDGLLVKARDIDKDGDVDEEVGAHCLGYNDKSIGVCLIGKRGTFTVKQMETLCNLIAHKCVDWDLDPAKAVLGHCETASGKAEGKTCPELDMGQVRAEVERRIKILRANRH